MAISHDFTEHASQLADAHLTTTKQNYVNATWSSWTEQLTKWYVDHPDPEPANAWADFLGTIIKIANQVLVIILVPIVLVWIAVLVFRWLWRKTPWATTLKAGYIFEDIEEVPNYQGLAKKVRVRITDELRAARKSARTLTDLQGPNANIPPILPPVPKSHKWLEPIFKKLGHRTYFVIKVTLVSTGNAKDTIHVRLSDSSGKFLESQRFDREPFDAPGMDGFRTIATRAGAWLVFMLSRHMQPKKRSMEHGRVVLYGTSSWESYAFLACGLHEKEHEEKKEWFEAALSIDPENIGAYIANGRQCTLQNLPDEAIENLRKARLLLTEQKGSRQRILSILTHGKARSEPTWYQATYNLTIASINKYFMLAQSKKTKADGLDSDNALEALDLALASGAELSRAVGATQLIMHRFALKRLVKKEFHVDLLKTLDREGLDLATIVSAVETAVETRSKILLEGDKPWGKAYDKSERHLWRLFSHLDAPQLDSATPEFPRKNSTRLLIREKHFGKLRGRSRVTANDILGAQQFTHKKSPTIRSEALQFIPTDMRYNRACTLVVLQKFGKAVEEFEEILKHDSGMTDYKWLDWIKEDPALYPLWAEEKEDAIDYIRAITDGRCGTSKMNNELLALNEARNKFTALLGTAEARKNSSMSRRSARHTIVPQ